MWIYLQSQIWREFCVSFTRSHFNIRCIWYIVVDFVQWALMRFKQRIQLGHPYSKSALYSLQHFHSYTSQSAVILFLLVKAKPPPSVMQPPCWCGWLYRTSQKFGHTHWRSELWSTHTVQSSDWNHLVFPIKRLWLSFCVYMLQIILPITFNW